MSHAMIESVKILQTSPTQKLLLFILADCHNDRTGQCNPSYRHLMQISGLSNKAVAVNLKALRDSKALFFDSRNGSNSHYKLTPERYICNHSEAVKPVNLVHRTEDQSSEPRSQDQNNQPVNLIPKPVNLVPKTSEPSSHKPVLTIEPELLAIAETQSLEPPPEKIPSKKRKPKKESTADPRHHEFIAIFAEAYQSAYSKKWAMNGAKDGNQLSKLLKSLPESELDAETWREALEWCQDTAQKEGRYAPKIIATGNLAAFCSNWSGIVAYSQTYQEPKK